ncbi:hypothetical protein [Enterococcus faecium]|uniref:hypothetical protein n=1 Tax=Enterococcus faecium TaxID=1352 RepID=UPI001F514DE3|nr:hypothetical protein [Enterococcus faecium]
MPKGILNLTAVYTRIYTEPFFPFFPLIYFLEEIWDDMACDSAFLFSHSLGIMISLMIFAIVLFF